MLKFNLNGIAMSSIVFSFISLITYGSYNFILGQITNASTQATLLANTKHLAQIGKLKAKYKKDMTQLKLKHKKEISKLKLKQRGKAKIQRAVSVLPFIGVASLVVFEKFEFDEWKKDRPNGHFNEYANETSTAINELLMGEYKEFGHYYEDFMLLKEEYLRVINK